MRHILDADVVQCDRLDTHRIACAIVWVSNNADSVGVELDASLTRGVRQMVLSRRRRRGVHHEQD
jgi:hypothetical protein